MASDSNVPECEPVMSATRLQMIASTLRDLLAYQAELKAEFDSLGLDSEAETFPLFLDLLCDPVDGLAFAEQTLTRTQSRAGTNLERLRQVLAENPLGVSNAEAAELSGLTSTQVSNGLYTLKQRSEACKTGNVWVLASTAPADAPIEPECSE